MTQGRLRVSARGAGRLGKQAHKQAGARANERARVRGGAAASARPCAPSMRTALGRGRGRGAADLPGYSGSGSGTGWEGEARTRYRYRAPAGSLELRAGKGRALRRPVHPWGSKPVRPGLCSHHGHKGAQLPGDGTQAQSMTAYRAWVLGCQLSCSG